MEIREYGKENRDVILLLHGGGLSWWNYREEALLLQEKYHVVLPILDGHSGSDRDFTSMEDNAAEIIAYIDEQFGGSVLLIGGLSLGAQILLEILAQRPDICRYAVVESALVVPSRLTHAMIAPAFGSCYGLIRYRWFSRLQFWSLKIRQELFEDYYRDTCGITRQNMIAFLQANSLYAVKPSLGICTARVTILTGQKENRAIRVSARKLLDAIPGSIAKVLPGLAHGEFSLNHPEEYVRELLNTIAK